MSISGGFDMSSRPRSIWSTLDAQRVSLRLWLLLVLKVCSSELSRSSSEWVSREVASDKVSSEKVSSDDEDDDSGEKKEGKSVEIFREGTTSPNSFADAIAPTGSDVVKTVGGEDERGHNDAERVGRRAFSVVSFSVLEEGLESRELRLADLIIFLSSDSVDLGTENAARLALSATFRG